MTTKNIRIVPDAGVPDGGHAIILLDGVWLLPEPATFRIEPLDDTIPSDELKGWPNGERRPRLIRTTSRGIELLIGPDIVDAPDLVPGTPISISVPAADVHAEVRWPDLPLSRPTGRGKVVLQHAKSSVLATATAMEAAGRPMAVANSNGASPIRAAAVQPRARQRANPQGLSELQIPHQAAANNDQPMPADTARMPKKKAPVAATPVRRSGSAMSPMVPMLIGLVLTGGLVAFLAPGLNKDVAALKEAREGEVATVEKGVVKAPTVDIYSIFEAGDTSPRGLSADGVSGQDALLLANKFLNGVDGKVDKEESAFWLRKAISKELSNRRTTWALTQLGSIYAGPSKGAPDYQSARVLWEMAAANGDPVAACFVARLYEFGLGVPVDLATARKNYERAQRLGGCAGLNAALARVGS
ncbi:MAG: sel1 repeat family protein [Alphaproteobacteria bacterium]|nr:sel1 repeat family protein [Alphaproteobacteria bacterium]